MIEIAKPSSWWRYRYFVAGVLFFAYSIQYLDRIKTTVLAPLIMNDVGLSHEAIGTGIFLMMIFYGPSQFISGWLCDRYSAKKVLIFSLISWIILTAYMAEMKTPLSWYIRMAIFGMLVGTEYVPSARILMRWFPSRQRAQAQSSLAWAWILTPAWATILATQLAALFGSWRPVFLVAAGLGVIPLILILVFIKDRPEQLRGMSQLELEESYEDDLADGIMTAEDLKSGNIKERIQKKVNIPMKQILRYPGFWAIALVDVACQMTFWGVIAWSPTYLTDVFKFSITNMGIWAAVYFIAGIVGAYLSGRISDKYLGSRRRPMIVASFFGTLPMIVILALLPAGVSHAVLLITLALAGFFANAAWGPFLAWPADVFSPEVYGKAMGFVNMLGYIGGAFAPLIMSRLIIINASGTHYTYAWLFIAGSCALGLVAALFVRDKKYREPVVSKVSVKAIPSASASVE